MKITEAYITDNINEEQFVGHVQPMDRIVNKTVRRVRIPEIWEGSYYNSPAPKEQKAYDMATD